MMSWGRSSIGRSIQAVIWPSFSFKGTLSWYGTFLNNQVRQVFHSRTLQGTKYVGENPAAVVGGPGLFEHQHLLHMNGRTMTYHMRFAVVMPALCAVAHI